MKKLFGTDGIRGVVGEEIVSPEMGYKIGRSLVNYCLSKNIKPEILIGYDTRESSSILEKAIISGVTSISGQVKLAGVIPTPGLAYLTKEENVGIGIMISASHNDYTFNGFKFFTHKGVKFSDNEEKQLEELILNEEFPLKSDLKYNNINSKNCSNAYEKYVDFLIDRLGESFSLKGLRVILDCAHGATHRIAPYIFKKLGADTSSLFIKPNGRNINKNCGSEYTAKLKQEVKRTRADVAFAFDGDGDRLIAIDEKGNELNGDHKLYIYSQMLKILGKLNNDTVVSTEMSNIGLTNALNELDIKHVATDVGDRQVYKEMKNTGAVLGGEESGHIIFLDYHTSGDGILSALMLLLATKTLNKPLSVLADSLFLYPKILVNVPVNKKLPLSSVPEIARAIKETKKYFGQQGRVFIRYSGTEPLCRIMIEGREKNVIEEQADRLANVIKNYL